MRSSAHGAGPAATAASTATGMPGGTSIAEQSPIMNDECALCTRDDPRATARARVRADNRTLKSAPAFMTSDAGAATHAMCVTPGCAGACTRISTECPG